MIITIIIIFYASCTFYSSFPPLSKWSLPLNARPVENSIMQ